MLDAAIFTTPLDPEIAGDDPLGLAPMNERLYNAVFPGMNNVVRYIRVYSSLCWVVNQVENYFQKHHVELNKGDAVRIANDAYEKIQLILTWVNKEKGHTQLAGAGRKFPSDDQKVRLVFKTFGQSTASLLEAVSYRPSLTTGLGFLIRKPDGTYSCTEAGLTLAKAFDTHARTSSEYEWLADVTKLDGTRSKVFALESVFDVGIATEEEQTAFIGRFFPTSKITEYDQLTLNRWLSLYLTLRAVQATCKSKKANGIASYATEEEVRACMARGRTFSGDILDFRGVVSVQVWWSVLQLRQLHRLALDYLFSVTEQWLDDRNLDFTAISLDDCANSIGQCALTGLEADYTDSVVSLIDFFKEAQGQHPTLYVAAAHADIDEDRTDLFQYVQDLRGISFGFDSDGGNDAVSSAYIALIFCATEVRNLLLDPQSEQALRLDQDQCSLLALAQLAERMKGTTPQQFVSYLIRHWVILRHFQIVCDRSQNADGKNRFRFVLGDNGLQRFNPAVGVTVPAFAQDKLRHVLYLCHQSGLIDKQDDGYKLTPYGRTRLSGLTG